MKRTILILLSIILISFLFSCGTSSDESASSNVSSVTSLDSQDGIEEENSPIESSSSTSSAENGSISDTATDEYSWEHLSSTYPYVSYDEIESGKYPDQYVILPVIIESSEYNNLTNWVKCDVWLSHETTFRKNDLVFDVDDFNLDTCDPRTIQPTDNIDVCIYINKDNSFGTDIISFNKNDSLLTLDEVQNTFRENCQPLNYTDILRTPDSFFGMTYSLSGSIFQITKQKDSIVEFLLNTGSNDEYVYVIYFYKDGESKFLEGDELTIYGTFYILYDYVSVLGTSHSIPQISAEFIENNSVK